MAWKCGTPQIHMTVAVRILKVEGWAVDHIGGDIVAHTADMFCGCRSVHIRIVLEMMELNR